MNQKLLNDFKKCINNICGKVVDEKQRLKERQKYIDETEKMCSKDNKKCVFKQLKKSKFYQMTQKKNKCIRVKCKKEESKLQNEINKSTENNRKKSLKKRDGYKKKQTHHKRRQLKKTKKSKK